MTGPVFRWSGEYFGFTYNGALFSKVGGYLGWVELDGQVWRKDGYYLGELVEGNYVLRRNDVPDDLLLARQIPPDEPPGPPPEAWWVRGATRAPREPLSGWRDALDEFRG